MRVTQVFTNQAADGDSSVLDILHDVTSIFTIHLAGTFGGGTVSVLVSLDGTTFSQLLAPDGTPVSISVPGVYFFNANGSKIKLNLNGSSPTPALNGWIAH